VLLPLPFDPLSDGPAEPCPLEKADGGPIGPVSDWYTDR